MNVTPDIIVFIAGTAWLIPLLHAAFNPIEELDNDK